MQKPDLNATPSLRRRLASMVYEAMLLFGVLFISGWLFSTLLQQRHALYLRGVLQDWLFIVIGLYFVWFWTHGGQTLAMKTWHIRLEKRDGGSVDIKRAIARYLLAWLWILPGLGIAWSLGVKGWLMIIIPAVNVLLWSITIYLDPRRQFLHDRIVGTRVVNVPPLTPTAIQ